MRRQQHRAKPPASLDALVRSLGEETHRLLTPVASAVRKVAEEYPTVRFTAYVSTIRMAALLTAKCLPVGTTAYALDGLNVRPEPAIDGGTLRVITESPDEEAAKNARRDLFRMMGWPCQDR